MDKYPSMALLSPAIPSRNPKYLKNTRSKIISKGISAGFADNTYRGLVDIARKADNTRN